MVRSHLESDLITNLGPAFIPRYKMAALGASIILNLGLLFLSYRCSIRTLVKMTLLTFILGLGLFEGLSLVWNPSFINFPMLFAGACHLLSPSICLLMGWGTLNSVTTLAEGFKYYIPLIVLSSLVATPFTIASSQLLISYQPPRLAFSLMTVGILVSAFYLHRWALNRKLSEPESLLKMINSKILTLLSLSVLFSMPALAQKWLNFDMKSWMKRLYPKAGEYSQAMGDYSYTQGIGILLISFLFLLLGDWILRKKNWGRAASLIPGVLMISLVTLIKNQVGSPSLAWYSCTMILLSGIHYYWAVPLAQLVFLKLPLKKRLPLLAWTCLILTPMISNGLTPQWAIALLNSDRSHRQALIIGFILVSIAVSLTSIRYLKQLFRNEPSVLD